MGERTRLLFGKLTLRPSVAPSSWQHLRRHLAPQLDPQQYVAAEARLRLSGLQTTDLAIRASTSLLRQLSGRHRKSRMPHSHAIERPALEAHAGHEFGRSSTSSSTRRPNKLGSPHADEQPLFVSIVHEALPAPRINPPCALDAPPPTLHGSHRRRLRPSSRLLGPSRHSLSTAARPNLASPPSCQSALQFANLSRTDDSDVDQPPRYDVVVDPAGTHRRFFVLCCRTRMEERHLHNTRKKLSAKFET